MLKAVLFDMDGVLVDTEPEYIRLELRLAREYGIPMTRREQRLYCGVNPAEMWPEVVRAYGSSVDPAQIARVEYEHMDAYYHDGPLRPIRPSVRLLKRCAKAGLKAAIATSSKADNAENVVRRLDLGPYVQAVAVANLVARGKPAPDIFLLAARMLGVLPEECVVIEDSVKGVQAAKAAGMKAVGLCGSEQDLSKADIVVRTLRGMKVERLGGLVE